MITDLEAIRAAKIARKFHNSVVVKSVGDSEFAVCIGYSDKGDDRAFRAIAKEMGWGIFNNGLSLCDDVTGGGVEVVATL